MNIHLSAALAIAAGTSGVATAGDSKALADHPALSGVIIESDTGAPVKNAPLLPATPFLEDAARREADRLVTRMDRPDGSTIYRYNGLLQERLVMTRSADGKLHVVCGNTAHAHVASHAEEIADDR